MEAVVLSTRTDTAGITLDVLGRAEQWEDAMVSWRDCVYKDCEHTKCVQKKEPVEYRKNIVSNNFIRPLDVFADNEFDCLLDFSWQVPLL